MHENAVQYPNIFQIQIKIIIKWDKNSGLRVLCCQSTLVILLDSTEQICTLFELYNYYLVDIQSHMVQSGVKLQSKCLLSW